MTLIGTFIKSGKPGRAEQYAQRAECSASAESLGDLYMETGLNISRPRQEIFNNSVTVAFKDLYARIRLQ